jgi:phage baseplate assembly protein W
MINTYGEIPTEAAATLIRSYREQATYGLTPLPGAGQDDPYFGRVSGRKRVLSGLDTLFNTGGGERLMMPDFGLDLQQYLFEPLDTVIIMQIRDKVMAQIITYFGDEIKVNNLSVSLTDKSKYRGVPGVLIVLNAEILVTEEVIDLTMEM